MQPFSDDLRQQRERLGVSLETIAEVTRIAPRHLFALEAGNIDQLPSGVFRHGILRNYLSVLGLDPAPWIERFDAEQQPTTADPNHSPIPTAQFAEFAENIHRSRPQPSTHHDFRWLGVLLMLLVLVALGWSLWRYVFHGHVVLSTSAVMPIAYNSAQS